MTKKTSNKFLARGVEAIDGRWYGMWSAPGFVPGYVTHASTGEPLLYESKRQAELEACRAVIGALNSRTHMRTPDHRYKRMLPAELSAAIEKTGLSRADLALLWGSSQERIAKWESGAEDIPFALWWALKFLADPAVSSTALDIATGHAAQRRELTT